MAHSDKNTGQDGNSGHGEKPAVRLVTIPQLARIMNRPDKAVRRYIERFPEFFESTAGNGKRQKYAPETIRVLRRIEELYNRHKSKADVYRILAAEFVPVVPIDEIEPAHARTIVPPVLELGPETRAEMEKTRDVLKRIAAALERLAEKELE